MKEFLGIE